MGAKGGPKTGGRRKGSLNKKTLALNDMLEQKGFDVIERLKNAFDSGDLAAAELLIQVLPYIAPKLKERETSSEVVQEDTQDLEKIPTIDLEAALKSAPN